MLALNFTEGRTFRVTARGYVGVTCREVFTPDQGAPTYMLRVLDVERGGETVRHQHPYEHEVFVLEGQGEVWTEAATVALRPGMAVMTMPGERHQFRNKGEGVFRFICTIPNNGVRCAGEEVHG